MTYESIVNSALVVGMALSPSACGGGSQAGTGGGEQQAEAEGDGDGRDDLPEGDGDPWTGDDDPEPLCDVSQLPALEPLWLDVEQEGPLGNPFIQSMAMTTDALFVGAGYSHVNGATPDYHLTRRALDGDQTWSLNVPSLGYMLGSDGVHLYYNDGLLDGSLSRVTVQGVHEPWSIPYPEGVSAGQLTLGADQSTFIIYGNEVTEVGDPAYSDAFVSRLDKNGAHIGTVWFGESGQDDYAVRAVEAGGGGFYVMIAHGLDGKSYSVEGVGVDGPPFSGEVSTGGPATSILHMEGGLLIGGHHSNVMWTRELAFTGEESWRNEVVLCGEAPVRHASLVETTDRLWGVVGIDDGSMLGVAFVVQLDFEGRLLSANRVDGLTEGAQIDGIVSNGEEVVISGFDHENADGVTTFLARLQ